MLYFSFCPGKYVYSYSTLKEATVITLQVCVLTQFNFHSYITVHELSK